MGAKLNTPRRISAISVGLRESAAADDSGPIALYGVTWDKKPSGEGGLWGVMGNIFFQKN